MFLINPYIYSAFSPIDISGLQLWTDFENSGGRHYITANGNAKITTATDPFGNSNGVGAFDGSDYLSIPDSSDFVLSSQHTISTWVKTSTVTGIWQVLVQQYGPSGSASNAAFNLFITATGKASYIPDWSNYPSFHELVSTTTVTDDSWHQIMAVKDGNNYYLFVDGQIEDTLNLAYTHIDTGYPVTIGFGNQGNSSPYTGYMSDVFILNGEALYTSNFTIPTEPFTADANTVLLLPMTGTNNSTVFVDYANPDNSGPVNSWNDLSGNYNHARQSTSGYRPILDITNGITFDGSDDVLTQTFSQSQPFTIYMVTNVTAGASAQGLIGDSNAYVSFTADEYLNLYAGSSITGITDLSGSDKVFIAVVNNTSSEVIADEVSQATGTAGTGALATLNIGSNGTDYANAKYKAVLVYSGSHTPSQINQVRNYLNSIYGL